MILTEKDQARFWSKVALPDGNGCMLWLGARNDSGYGVIHLAGRMERAHRISYTLANGQISGGLVLDHLCRVPACVAPLHLEAVTVRENTRRGQANAWRVAKTQCPEGHPYDAENTYTDPRGRRECRACRREHSRRYRVRRATRLAQGGAR